MSRHIVPHDQFVFRRSTSFNLTLAELDRLQSLAAALDLTRHQTGLRALLIGLDVIEAELAATVQAATVKE